MDRIVIRAHHDRWGLYEDPDQPPISEYETREAAELAARGHGGEVVVDEGEPRRSDTDPGTPGERPGPATGSPREVQGGL